MSRYVDINRLEPQQFENSEVELGVLAYDYEVVQSEPYIDLVRCAECHWARPRTLKGETGYRCLFYRVDKAENGYCDCGERASDD